MRSSVFFAGALLLALAGSAAAEESARANIPFDFVVNGTTMHAGAYTIRQMDINNPTELFFDGGKKGRATVMARSWDRGNTSGKLVFDNAEQTAVLKSFSTSAGTFQFAQSRTHKHAKNAAAEEQSAGK